MVTLHTLDADLITFGTTASIPIVARLPEAANAVASMVSVFLNGLNVAGDPALTFATESRVFGDTPVTVVTGVQVGAPRVTSAAMRLVVYYADLQEETI